MLFTSLEFLFLFFPLVFAVNYLLPLKWQNYWLLISSLFFYAWGEPVFVLAMLFSIALNYTGALLISREDRTTQRGQRRAKAILVVTLLINLSILFVYKYMNFTTKTLLMLFPSLNTLFGATEFVLPIGISFFTFQALSYVVDVYRGEPVQKNIAYVGLYVSLFPQLIAGPIVRYTTVAAEIVDRRVTRDDFCFGMYRFFIGFNKKMLLANILAQAADFAFGQSVLSTGMAWIGIMAYTLQIYFDFSGYSEMAIGLGRMLGFHFLENFDYPYISRTITEFWRRWHMSLGTWFRDYVYFPLGGSRVKSRARLVFNLFVVWLATGVWHGASFNFILWGVLYGVIITVEKLLALPKKLSNKPLAGGFYQLFTMLMVMFGWVLFRAVDLPSAMQYFKALFGMSGLLWDGNAALYLQNYAFMGAVGVLCSTPICRLINIHLCKTRKGAVISGIVGPAWQCILFLISVSYLVMNAHNPFIYFNF